MLDTLCPHSLIRQQTDPVEKGPLLEAAAGTCHARLGYHIYFMSVCRCPDLFTATCEQRVMDKEEDREKINHNKKAL